MRRDAYQMAELVGWAALIMGLTLIWVSVPGCTMAEAQKPQKNSPPWRLAKGEKGRCLVENHRPGEITAKVTGYENLVWVACEGL